MNKSKSKYPKISTLCSTPLLTRSAQGYQLGRHHQLDVNAGVPRCHRVIKCELAKGVGVDDGVGEAGKPGGEVGEEGADDRLRSSL